MAGQWDGDKPKGLVARPDRLPNSSVADLCQIVFRQAGHFHDGNAIDTVLQHGTGNFQLAFIPAFLPACLTGYPSVRAAVRWS